MASQRQGTACDNPTMAPAPDGWTTPATIHWTEWLPLAAAVRGMGVPATPGLYRIRRAPSEHLDYLGQTGAGSMTLRKRMAMLRGIYAAEMPYRDPHTAGPALWALRDLGHENFEASFAVVVGDTPWRKGLECVALAQHRQRFGTSPSVNFGRMPAGYRMSSANNRVIVTAGRRFRGGPVTGLDEAHLPGVPPAGLIGGTPTSADWCGHRWSEWSPADAVPVNLGTGLYRIRGIASGHVVYIGEGAIRERIRAHLAKVRTSDHAQGRILASDAPLAVSWVAGPWKGHQRLELENDLIAAHVLAVGTPPAAQFLG